MFPLSQRARRNDTEPALIAACHFQSGDLSPHFKSLTHRQKHRGPHPDDAVLFSPDAVELLRAGAADFRWLLDRGYASTSTLKLVGDRYNLLLRQRQAIARAVCSAADATHRRSRELSPADLRGRTLLLDGFNILVTLEAAHGGGVLLACDDGCIRDMASMQGTYRKMSDTPAAILEIGDALKRLALAECVWCLDSPVSNSGRLKQMLLVIAKEHGWPWRVDLVADPDNLLAAAPHPIATADSGILTRCGAWFNLSRHALETRIEQSWLLDLRGVTK